MARPCYLVVMGVAGAGKSTVAVRLAERLGWPFIEGDALHPAANIEKMRGGNPLDDADRQPWLALVAQALENWRNAGSPGVITCSALRGTYRAAISGGQEDVCFVYLRGSREFLAQRVAARHGHFMPAALLESQFETLEEPLPPEPVITADAALPLEALVGTILLALETLCL